MTGSNIIQAEQSPFVECGVCAVVQTHHQGPGSLPRQRMPKLSTWDLPCWEEEEEEEEEEAPVAARGAGAITLQPHTADAKGVSAQPRTTHVWELKQT